MILFQGTMLLNDFANKEFALQSKNDVLVFQLSDPTPTSAPPEMNSFFSTTEPSSVAFRDENYITTTNLGVDLCTSAVTVDIQNGKELMYMLCNENDILRYTRQIFPDMRQIILPYSLHPTVPRISVFDRKIDTASKCYDVIEAIVSGTTSQFFVFCKKSSQVSKYMLIAYGEDGAVPEIALGYEMNFDSTKPIETNPKVIFLELIAGGVSLKVFVIWRKPSNDELIKATPIKNNHLLLVNSADKTSKYVDVDLALLKEDYSIIIDIAQAGPDQITVIGYAANSPNPKITVLEVGRDLSLILKSTYTIDRVTKGWVSLKKQGLVYYIVFGSFVDNHIGSCLFSISGIDIPSCKTLNGKASEIPIESIGCNDNGCFFNLISSTNSTQYMGYQYFNPKNAAPVQFTFKFDAKLISFAKYHIEFITKNNYLRSANFYKSTFADISLTSIPVTGKEIMILKRTYNEGLATFVDTSIKYTFKSVKGIFDDIVVPSSVSKQYWYRGEFLELEFPRQLIQGNGLSYSIETTDATISSQIFYDNPAEVTFNTAIANDAKTIIMGDYAISLKPGDKMTLFKCTRQNNIAVKLSCTMLQEYQITANEKLITIASIDKRTIAGVLSGPTAGISKFFLMSQDKLQFKEVYYDIISAVIARKGSTILLYFSTMQQSTNTIYAYSSPTYDISVLKEIGIKRPEFPIKFSCVGQLYLDEFKTLYGIDNCGKGRNILIEINIDQITGNILPDTPYTSKYFLSEEVQGAQQNNLQFCIKGKQLLLHIKGSKNLILTEIGKDIQREDLGFPELKVAEVMKLECPLDVDFFLVFIKTEAGTYHSILYRWGQLLNLLDRNIYVSNPLIILELSDIEFVYHDGKEFLSYTEKGPVRKYRELSLEKPRVFIKTTSKDASTKLNLIATNIQGSKKVPMEIDLVDFAKIPTILNISKIATTLGTHPLAPLIQFTGPILSAQLEGDATTLKSYQLIERLNYTNSFEQTTDPGTSSFDYFKKFHYDSNMMLGLVDIMGLSYIYVYSNSEEYTKRVETKLQCSDFDFDFISNKKTLAIFGSCKDLNNVNGITMITTSIDKFDVSTEVYLASTPHFFDKMEIWKAEIDFSFLVVGKTRVKEGIYKLEVFKVSLDELSKDYRGKATLKFESILSVDNGIADD